MQHPSRQQGFQQGFQQGCQQQARPQQVRRWLQDLPQGAALQSRGHWQ
eukprot:gene10377-biopygen9265